jgi:hypothetical protein
MSLVPDSQNLDSVTVLAMHICAAARPDDPVDFVRKVCRLIDVAVTEALEEVEPLPHVRVDGGDRIPPGIVDALRGACPYCHEVLPVGVAHTCTRKAELGFDRDDDKPSSMGAGGAESSADHPSNSAASEASAAPSTSPHIPPASASESPGAALSVPAEAAAQAAETPRAPSIGLPCARRMTPEQAAQMRVDFDAARLEHGAELPRGWIHRKAAELGFSDAAVWGRVKSWLREPVKGPASKRNGAERPHVRAQVHVNSHACWCRQGANTAATPWCALKPLSGPVPTLAGISDRRKSAFRRPTDYEAD